MREPVQWHVFVHELVVPFHCLAGPYVVAWFGGLLREVYSEYTHDFDRKLVLSFISLSLTHP
jgi:hypothetical protein